MEWDALTLAEIYKKRCDILLFFKVLKHNLQVETFLRTSENAVKSQIYIVMITFLLLELIKRTIEKIIPASSNFVEKIRMSQYFYLSLDYVCNIMCEGAGRIKQGKQMNIPRSPDFFLNTSNCSSMDKRIQHFFSYFKKLTDESDKIIQESIKQELYEV